MENNADKNYNFIYEKLVDGDKDIVGMIAYSLYKMDKIKYLKETINRKGSLDAVDISNFHTLSEINIKVYIERASGLFAETIDEIIEKKAIVSEDSIFKTLDSIVKKESSWLKSILQSALGSLTYTLFAIAIYFIFAVFNTGAEKKITDTAKTKIDNTIQNTFNNDSIK